MKLVDPSKWPEDINVNIRVGLGTGSKDKRIQARMMLAPIMAGSVREQAGRAEAPVRCR
ncbi:portal protein [Sphingomonas sp. MMS24-JH45]